MSKVIYYVTTNFEKAKEMQFIMENKIIVTDVKIVMFNKRIDEIQSNDIEEIVKDKLVKAYKELQRPLIVEQTGLCIKDFGGLPDGLTTVFWDRLGSDKSSREKKMIEYFESKDVTAISCIGYCDGKKMVLGIGEVGGKIIRVREIEKNSRNGFGWDRIFLPNNYDRTFSEMTIKEKCDVSMRTKAFFDLEKQYKIQYSHLTKEVPQTLRDSFREYGDEIIEGE